MNQKIRTLKIIHFSICIGMVMCYLIIGQLATKGVNLSIQKSDLVYLLIPLGAIAVGHLLFTAQLKQLNQLDDVDKKFSVYQSASIVRWAIIEGAALLILIMYPHLAIFGILLIAYLIILYPSSDKVEKLLNSNNY